MRKTIFFFLILSCLRAGGQSTQTIAVTNVGPAWEIVGLKQRVRFDPASLGIAVWTAGSNRWEFRESTVGDLSVRDPVKTRTLRLADAREKQVSPYTTGYATGLKVDLIGYADGEAGLDLRLQLLLALDGGGEDLVCEILASDGEARVQELAWPAGCKPDSFDATVVPFMQGMLLPKDFPEKAWLYDTLSYGRGLYMHWWGFQHAGSAMLAALETPADAGCRFEHPAGGPTRLDVRWVHSLNRWSYPRRVRFSFLDEGDYVDLALRYRQRVAAAGRLVTLREKIARNPRVERLIGAPVVHTSILYHIQPDSSYFNATNPAANDQLTTFTNRAADLEKLAALGFTNAYVHLDGWGLRGYDNLHPDVLPPCPASGGWDGMRYFSTVCDRLGFLFAIHDQYRDFYLDAASYDPRHTVIEANGSRPTWGVWYGGKQSILCSRLAPGHVRQNHQAILQHGVLLRGAYLDVFSVVPPDECYAPEHPVTRLQCLEYRAECLNSVRSWGGVVSSEEPSDWSAPILDLVHHGPYALRPGPGSGPAMGIPVPLFNLVYHDSLLLPWSLGRGAWGIPEKDLGYLHGLANAGLPYLDPNPSSEDLLKVRAMMALHRRLALVALTGHRFLDDSRRRQRFDYGDGTQVTIDLEKDSFEIAPPL